MQNILNRLAVESCVSQPNSCSYDRRPKEVIAAFVVVVGDFLVGVVLAFSADDFDLGAAVVGGVFGVDSDLADFGLVVEFEFK